jgi:5-methylcytosine-specific restriction endonuclease McrA
MERACKKCGGEGPFYVEKNRKDGLSARCKACVDAASKAWRTAHPDESRRISRTSHRRRYPVTAATKRAASRAWKARNPARVQATRREYYATNGEKERAAQLTRYAANPAAVQAATKAWRKAHPEKVRAQVKRRRAVKAGVVSTLTAAEWLDILEYFGHACAYCLRTDRPLTQDHVVALSRGGEHTKENVVPACQGCNSRKGNRRIFAMLPKKAAA